MTEEELRARERIERSRARRQRQLRTNMFLCAGLAVLTIIVIAMLAVMMRRDGKPASNFGDVQTQKSDVSVPEPVVKQDLLPLNQYSRPGTALTEVTGIVVHYTANPGTSAKQNRDYFAGLAETHTTSASSHYVIGLEGEIIQCIPCEEIAYASKARNVDTIAIECCIEDETGRFNSRTYDALVQLTAWLACRYGLESDAVLRHYDVTGKNCPKYYVENESSWRLFKSDVWDYIKKEGRSQ